MLARIGGGISPHLYALHCDPSSEMARLTDLSPELIARILDFSDWPAYLQLALSCRYLARCSQVIMARHRACHALYKATSDISPKTLPTLCRALLKDPVAISHVLALEFWGQRVAWDDWKPYAVRLPDYLRAEGSGGAESQRDGDSVVEEELLLKQYELDALEKIMHDEIRLCDEDSKSWRKKIEEGDDGAMKGMLIALCPNLQAVRFVKYAEPESEGSDAEENEDEEKELYRHHQSCLDFLVAAIEAQYENSWSPGFSSLSCIAVGVPSRAAAAPQDSPHRIFSEQSLPLFRLPNLQSLYLNGLTLTQEQLDDEDNADLDFSDKLPPGSSPSLRELVIEDAGLAGSGDVAYELLDTMMSASDGLLRMAFQNGCVTGFSLDRILPNGNSAMQSLLFYGAVEVQGYRSEMYDPAELNTPVFTVNISDVMLCAPSANGDSGEVDGVGTWGMSRSQFGEYLFDVFGDTWGAIVFVGTPSEKEAEMVDEGLVTFIKSVEKGWLYEEGDEDEEDEEDEASNEGDSDSSSQVLTRAIYLEGIDYSSLQTTRWYAKAIEAGKEAGIQVHTRTTPAPREHPFPFPWPASDKELQTSPLYGHPVLDRYLLKPHAGLVMDDCGNCGACKRCLDNMAAWAKAHEEEEESERMEYS
ncbi:hypothetical protein P171DRAFT_473231 [Karstenula rhodostoma CBS 690.94]|uniref:F-box domain-containing protein n=1 Tax=Karstenula rhodostoma CBS 690.94 TaxID=1392251 RepID=A0A9P4PHE9_9PLEO|nr:hypothetical protein P171DRAFT_473231 [Karstenula rhodostoma CBS 690.94]